jgi:hypothetical protein
MDKNQKQQVGHGFVTPRTTQVLVFRSSSRFFKSTSACLKCKKINTVINTSKQRQHNLWRRTHGRISKSRQIYIAKKFNKYKYSICIKKKFNKTLPVPDLFMKGKEKKKILTWAKPLRTR